MACKEQKLTDTYAIYNGDSCEVLGTIPSESVHLSIYSPPFAGLYTYSSDPRDLSNARTYAEFLKHYAFIIQEIHRVTLPGRISAVHCTDVPQKGANIGGYVDFPGDVIRLHEQAGFEMLPRICIWKEPLTVRNRTMMKALAHRQIVEDSTRTNVAASDYLIPFRKTGDNPVPVTHPAGLLTYYGEKAMPQELSGYKAWAGKQTENRFSHWIWRQYASAIWDDIRLDEVLPYKEAKEPEDEKHPHPLQLDAIARAVELWTNEGEVVLTPFMGVGSEVYQPVKMGRRAIGVELKSSYFRQALKNLEMLEFPDAEQVGFLTARTGLPMAPGTEQGNE